MGIEQFVISVHFIKYDLISFATFSSKHNSPALLIIDSLAYSPTISFSYLEERE